MRHVCHNDTHAAAPCLNPDVSLPAKSFEMLNI